jgi:DNA polymerase-3 subunit alpha
MGKKKPEEMAKQRAGFVDGAVARGIDAKQAAWIFDLIEKFAGYGFNKSHSAAYGLLSYQTAWLKQHYPAAFMAAVLSSDIDHTDKVVTLIDECNHMHLTILPPDVNESQHAFTVADDRTIRYGLGAIRGVGEGAVQAMVAEREARGPFRSIEDLCRRLDLTRLNRRVLEALIRSGSLDRLGPNRASLMQRLTAAMQAGEQHARALAAGQVDFFGAAPVVPAEEAGDADLPAIAEWNEAQRLGGERETLGLYLTGHPIERFRRELPRLITGTLADLGSERPPASGEGGRFFGGRQATVAGLVLEIRKRGGRTSFVLDDRSGRMEVTIFEETFQQYRDLIAKDALLLVDGNLRFDEFSDAWRIAARRIQSLEAVREQQARRLVLTWPQSARLSDAALAEQLAQILAPCRPGECEVLVRVRRGEARCLVPLGAGWAVRPTAALMESLEGLLGHERLQVIYDLPPQGSPPGGLRATGPGP